MGYNILYFSLYIWICCFCFSLKNVDGGRTRVSATTSGVGNKKAEKEKEKSDGIVQLIEHDWTTMAMESLGLRYDDKKEIGPFLTQDVNLVQGFTTYKWPGTNKVAFRRHALDTHLKHLIFPTEKYFGGKEVTDNQDESETYTLMYRGKKNVTIYYLRGIYIRNDRPNPSIEWTHSDLWHPKKSKEETDFCQGKECGLSEFMLGTCFIVNRKCNTKDEIPVIPSRKSKSKSKGASEIPRKDTDADEDEDDDEGSEQSDEHEQITHQSGDEDKKSRKKRMIMSTDYYNRYSGLLRSNSTDSNSSLHVPTSFDLLQLWVEEDKVNGTREFLFKNRIDRRRRKSMELEEVEGTDLQRMGVETMIQAMACFECHRLGNFYTDLEEDSLYSQAIGTWVEKMIENGKMQRFKRSRLLRRFVGYGLCPYEMNRRSRPVSMEVDNVIDFYVRALKINCKIHEKLVETMEGWFRMDDSFLKINSDRTVGVDLESSLVKRPSLSRYEYDTLFSGLLFSKFTSLYNEQSFVNRGEKKQHKMSATNLTISQEIKFITSVFLQTLDAVRSQLPHHTIKMTRSLARLLRDKFMALLTSNASIHVYADRVQIMALKEFVVYGVRPILNSGMDSATGFLSFYTLNAKRIKLLVNTYDFTLEE